MHSFALIIFAAIPKSLYQGDCPFHSKFLQQIFIDLHEISKNISFDHVVEILSHQRHLFPLCRWCFFRQKILGTAKIHKCGHGILLGKENIHECGYKQKYSTNVHFSKP